MTNQPKDNEIIFEDIDTCDEGIEVYAQEDGTIKIVYALEAGYSKGTSYIPISILQKFIPQQISREAVEKLREKYVKIKQSAISNGGEAVLDIVIKDIDILLSKDKDGE